MGHGCTVLKNSCCCRVSAENTYSTNTRARALAIRQPHGELFSTAESQRATLSTARRNVYCRAHAACVHTSHVRPILRVRRGSLSSTVERTIRIHISVRLRCVIHVERALFTGTHPSNQRNSIACFTLMRIIFSAHMFFCEAWTGKLVVVVDIASRE